MRLARAYGRISRTNVDTCLSMEDVPSVATSADPGAANLNESLMLRRSFEPGARPCHFGNRNFPNEDLRIAPVAAPAYRGFSNDGLKNGDS